MALRNLALSVFFGGGVTVLLATRAIFRRAESRRQAGDFSGAVLRSFELLRWAALGLLIVARGWRPVMLLAPLVALNTLVDLRLRAMRDLDPADPRRKPFGPLHGVSVLLLIAQTIAAGAALALQ